MDGGDVIAEVLGGPNHGLLAEVSKLHRYHDIDDTTYRLYFVQGFYYLMENKDDTEDSGT